MLSSLWFTIIYQPLVNGLILFYSLLGHSLGWAIIGMTVALRLVLIPLTLPSLNTAQRMKDLQPHLEKLKKKHGQDKQKLAKAQMELYKQHGVNPAGGCLPWIIQFVVLIALYRVFNQVLAGNGEVSEELNKILYPILQLPVGTVFNANFFYLNLTKPDLIYLPFSLNLTFFKLDKLPGLFLIAAAIVQFLSSKMMMPQALAVEKQAKKTPQQEDDMAAQMQKQMLYLMPLMTIFIGFTFPSGLVLYWLTFSLVMAVQQIFINKIKQNKNIKK